VKRGSDFARSITAAHQIRHATHPAPVRTRTSVCEVHRVQRGRSDVRSVSKVPQHLVIELCHHSREVVPRQGFESFVAKVSAPKCFEIGLMQESSTASGLPKRRTSRDTEMSPLDRRKRSQQRRPGASCAITLGEVMHYGVDSCPWPRQRECSNSSSVDENLEAAP